MSEFVPDAQDIAERDSLTDARRVDLAAFLLDGLEVEQQNPAGPTSTATAGGETPAAAPAATGSAAILAAYREGRRPDGQRAIAGDPDVLAAFLDAKVREAAS